MVLRKELFSFETIAILYNTQSKISLMVGISINISISKEILLFNLDHLQSIPLFIAITKNKFEMRNWKEILF